MNNAMTTEKTRRLVAGPIALCTAVAWSGTALSQDAVPTPAVGPTPLAPDTVTLQPVAATEEAVDPNLKANTAAAIVELTEEEAAIAALMGDDDDDFGEEEYKLKFYGFSDVTYLGAFFGPKYGDTITPYPGFMVGRLNLYMQGEMGDGWRTLSEVRYTYLPNGSTPPGFGQLERTDQTVGDYADLGRPTPVGGIVIERAWLENTMEPWLNIRIGQYLTPYGIWNVDHGSPVILAMRRPFIISQAIFPERQVGLQLHGTGSSGAIAYGYNLTLSNGRGPIPYKEWDKNKALGWRLYANYDTDVGFFAFGTSGYLGDYTERTEERDPVTRRIVRPIANHYHEQSTAIDFKWTKGGALVQAELLVHDKVFNHSSRPFNPALFPGGASGFQPDERKIGYYGIGGYRFEFFGIMPWVGWSVFDIGGPAALQVVPRKVDEFFLGLNVRPHPRVVFKASYTRVMWRTKGVAYRTIGAAGNYLDLQTAWSF